MKDFGKFGSDLWNFQSIGRRRVRPESLGSFELFSNFRTDDISRMDDS